MGKRDDKNLSSLYLCPHSIIAKYETYYHLIICIYYFCRRNFEQILDVIVYGETSSSDSSSSDEDDIDVLLFEMTFAPKLKLGLRIHLEDINESDCENMFR